MDYNMLYYLSAENSMLGSLKMIQCFLYQCSMLFETERSVESPLLFILKPDPVSRSDCLLQFASIVGDRGSESVSFISNSNRNG